MSSFFTVPASQRKRKRTDGPSVPNTKRRAATKTSTTAPAGRARDRPQPSKRSQPRAASASEDDESISGSDSEDDVQLRRGAHTDAALATDDDTSADEGETAAERRLKLAERYLDNIRAEIGEENDEVGFDAAEIDRELIAARLKEDVKAEQGHMYRFIAGELDFERATHSFFRADTLSTTGVAVCPPYAYTVSKDITLIKWEFAPPPTSAASQGQKTSAVVPNSANASAVNGNKKKEKAPPPPRRKPRQLAYKRGNKNKANDPVYQNHTASILCIAASSDGKFLATGGLDRKLIIWDPATLTPLKVFTHHRDAVTSVAFRGNTNQLFSASKDRTVKIWSLNELAYVETLFGHQDEVVDVAAVGGTEERCVSVGARDRSARLWKVVDESQLVFRGGGDGGSKGDKNKAGKGRPLPTNSNTDTDSADAPPKFSEGSLDRITQPTSSMFVTGSDSGTLSTYALHKKKALHTIALAHGFDAALAPELSSAEADAGMLVDGKVKKTSAGPTARWITALTCVPFSDFVVSGSWDGCVRCWRIVTPEAPGGAGVGLGKGMARLELVGVLGRVVDDVASSGGMNGADVAMSGIDGNAVGSEKEQAPIRGVINDLKVFLRGDRGKDGVCIVAAVGTETRLGRWVQRPGKNGAVVFEIPRKGKGKGKGQGKVVGEVVSQDAA